LPGKKGGELVGKGRKETGTNVLILMDDNQTPLGAVITPANHHESRHIERLLDSSVIELPAPCRLIYDTAADNDPLRERLAYRDVELISPHRSNRVKPPTQDGRSLRRYRRSRWKVERTNAWLHNYGRFAMRKDRLGILFLGWTQLACLFTILKRLRRRFLSPNLHFLEKRS
jgi:transposase